jgi:mannosyl-3-phosphoglycerate phosphatase
MYIRSIGERPLSPLFAGWRFPGGAPTFPGMTSKQKPRSSKVRCAIFTAIDGTLLDSRTFDAGRNRNVIARLHDLRVPVIPMTVMTLDEIAPIAEALGLRDPMVIEAGSAIARWCDERWIVEACAPRAEAMLDVIREIEDLSGADIAIYSAMPESDASLLSGRTGDMLARSTHREFSEPFLVERGTIDEVVRAAATLGFSVRRGRRFLHLCKSCNEGDALTRLCDEIGCEFVTALGGSPLDADFLARADFPIIIPGIDGEADPELLERVPHARVASAPAPDGWAIAIEEVWSALVSAPGMSRARAALR